MGEAANRDSLLYFEDKEEEQYLHSLYCCGDEWSVMVRVENNSINSKNSKKIRFYVEDSLSSSFSLALAANSGGLQVTEDETNYHDEKRLEFDSRTRWWS